MAKKAFKMPKADKALLEDVYRGSYTIKELQTMRRKLAKRANQRMVRLERAESAITGEKFNTFGAIIDAYNYLERQRGKNRFQEKLNALDTQSDLKREITVLQGFLGRKSSTVAGMKDIENKRINTFESGKWGSYAKTGIPNAPIKFASNKEFYDFLSSDTFSGLVNAGFTSEQIVEIYEQAREKEPNDSDKIAQNLANALADFRAKGNANLKDLRKKMGVSRVKKSRK